MATRTNVRLNVSSDETLPEPFTDPRQGWTETGKAFTRIVDHPTSATTVRIPQENWVFRSRTLINDSTMDVLFERMNLGTTGRTFSLRNGTLVVVGSHTNESHRVDFEELSKQLEDSRRINYWELFRRAFKSALGLGPRVATSDADFRMESAADRVLSAYKRASH